MSKANEETSQVGRLVMFSIFALAGFFFYRLISHPHQYNTEQVCFNDDGEVIFYASGFKPSDAPVVHIAGAKYKNTENKQALKGKCKSTWGVSQPKGYDYWETKKYNSLN